jgi:hypothetical protein
MLWSSPQLPFRCFDLQLLHSCSIMLSSAFYSSRALEALVPGLSMSLGLLQRGLSTSTPKAAAPADPPMQPRSAARSSSTNVVARTPGATRLRVVGTPGARLRGFAAQPAYAEETDMFCFQVEALSTPAPPPCP